MNLNLRRYWRRVKEHVRGESTGLGGTRVQQIVLSGVVKPVMDLAARFLNRLHDPENRTWRHKYLDEERQELINLVTEEDGSCIHHESVVTMINFVYVLLDMDPPYYRTYQELLYTVQNDFREVDAWDPRFAHLKPGASPSNADEDFRATVEDLVTNHGVGRDTLLEEIYGSDDSSC